MTKQTARLWIVLMHPKAGFNVSFDEKTSAHFLLAILLAAISRSAQTASFLGAITDA